MLTDYITSALATLLVVADPVFLSAMFLGDRKSTRLNSSHQ